jgi:hypothetical protein
MTNETDQRERREVLRKDTYLARAQAEAEAEVGGRFKRLTPTTIVGATPVPSYPSQPSSSPYHSDPVPPEPPLGIDVNSIEPVGTPVEIEKSIVRGPAISPWAGPKLGGPST